MLSLISSTSSKPLQCLPGAYTLLYMIKNAKKTDAEKNLIKFRNQLHTLLIRNPEIRLATDSFGDIVAFIPEGDRPRVHLPTSGKQELISK